MLRNADELFGLEVQSQREEKGWSMTEFASMLSGAGLKNFHATTIGRMERGERPVRLSEAVVIANVLGSKLDDLVVEPLSGDDEVRWSMESLEMFSKKAARALDHIESNRETLSTHILEVRRQLEQGLILPDHVDAVTQTCKEGEALLGQDRVSYWVDQLNKLDAAGKGALYKSDPDFRF